MSKTTASGPLCDLKVIEFAGLGPAPFAGMLLSDMGADVVRIDRDDGNDYRPEDLESRGRKSIVIDLKNTAGNKLALSLIEKADILIEGFRPGVMERLGLGPDECLQLNPKLIYGRMTGWGQTGPLAQKAGHDINYLAISGALHALGTQEKPAVPLNLIADFGGGALYLIMGLLAALHHAQRTGEGQVVDCAMVDGVTSMLGMIYGDLAAGTWQDERESNVIDGAAPFYNVYQCADDRWISLAAIEPQFYQNFLSTAGVDDDVFNDQWNRDLWPQQKNQLAALFRGKTRDQWRELFANVDACVAPVLSLKEAQADNHNTARANFVGAKGIKQPAPAPKFSLTKSAIQFGAGKKNQHENTILRDWQIDRNTVENYYGQKSESTKR